MKEYVLVLLLLIFAVLAVSINNLIRIRKLSMRIRHLKLVNISQDSELDTLSESNAQTKDQIQDTKNAVENAYGTVLSSYPIRYPYPRYAYPYTKRHRHRHHDDTV